MNKSRKEFVYDACAYLGFIPFYLIAYRDMLFQTSLFWALNLVPLPTSNSRFYIPGQFYWFPGSLGTPAQPNIGGWLPYVFVLISGGDLVLAEKLLASTTLVSCFTMYFFLSNHFKGSRLARFSAALIYGFGPATVLNFTDILHWGYVAIPIVFNYLFNLFEEKRRIRDVLLLGLSLSFLTAFLPQILSLIFISFLIFLTVRTLLIAKRLAYVRKVSVSFSLALLVFAATSPYLISGTYQFLASTGQFPNETVLPPSFPNIYQDTYSNQEIATTMRLIGGSPGNHLPTNSWIGFLLPALAFSSLLLVQRGKRMLDLLALSLVSLVTITIIYGIHLESGWAMWMLNYTPIKLFFYPERPLYVVTFAYSVMISVALSRLIDVIISFRLNDCFKSTHSISWFNWRHVFSILLVFLLLTSVFLFAPVFDIHLQQERYFKLPSLYSSIQNWLLSHGEGEPYRVVFLPTGSFGSFSIIIGYIDIFEVAPGYALVHTSDYVDFVYNELVKGNLRNLGSLLAPASVKYIILATPNASTLPQGSTALPPPIHPVWDLQGEPRYYVGKVQGDPAKIAIILNNQRDLKLVYFGDDFRVYENEKYAPKISVFSNAAYIIGSESVLSVLPYLPSFNVNDVLLIFARQNPNLAEELSRVSSSIILFNSDLNDYIKFVSAQKYGISAENNYEETLDILTRQRQVYLFNTNSSLFARLVKTPYGQFWIAVNVPEPIMAYPTMGIIDLDNAQRFVITRENFKPVRNPPKWDFDNAEYYFYTAAGGQVSITFKGSGGVWAYVAYNSTPSSIGPFSPIFFPQPIENRTFDFDFPPNTIFQPMVNAYNTALDQNITNNLREIIIERKIGGEYSVLNVDGVNITRTPTSYANGWNMFGPVYLDSATHNVTITNGIKGSLVTIYNVEDLAQIFRTNASISYQASMGSETRYIVDIKTDSPVFLALSESYHTNWFAHAQGQRLMHFTASSFSNGFYLNRTEAGTVSVEVVYEPPLLNHVYVAQQILFAVAALFLIASPIAYRITHRIKNRRGD